MAKNKGSHGTSVYYERRQTITWERYTENRMKVVKVSGMKKRYIIQPILQQVLFLQKSE